jgi:hypothetical protein
MRLEGRGLNVPRTQVQLLTEARLLIAPRSYCVTICSIDQFQEQ